MSRRSDIRREAVIEAIRLDRARTEELVEAGAEPYSLAAPETPIWYRMAALQDALGQVGSSVVVHGGSRPSARELVRLASMCVAWAELEVFEEGRDNTD